MNPFGMTRLARRSLIASAAAALVPGAPAHAQLGSSWFLLPGSARDVGTGPDGSIFVIGVDRQTSAGFGIHRWNGSAFEAGAGAGMRIAVDPKGNPWVVNRQSEIWAWDGNGFARMPGSANDIGIGADGTVCVIGTNDRSSAGWPIYRWNGRSWASFPGYGTNISVDPEGRPWVVNEQNAIYRWTGSAFQREPVSAVDIGIGADGSVWAAGTDGKAHHYWRGTWAPIIDSRDVRRIAVDRNGMPLITNRNDQILVRV